MRVASRRQDNHLGLGRVGRVAVVVAALAGLPLALGGVATANPVAPVPVTSTATEGVDYTSEAYQDALDFTNVTDFNPTPATASERPNSVVSGFGLHNATVTNGVAAMTADPSGFFQIAQDMTNALSTIRDTRVHPIDTSRYTHLQLRMYSSSNAQAALFWFTCIGAAQGSCQGVKNFTTFAGWNTYDISIANTIGNTAWSGSVRELRLYPNFTAGPALDVKLDWLRLAAPGTNINVTIPQAADQVLWDTDTNLANNPGITSSAFAGSVGAGGTAVFPAGALPPGTYYVYYTSGGVPSAYSTPIVVAPRPQPVVLDPNVGGGDDWATTVRGDAWDFDQASDVQLCNNCTMNVAGGYANGSNAGPTPNDNQVYLPVPAPIDANLYHRLTVKVHYDGTFGLADAPGGGMVSRFLWAVPDGLGGANWTETNDMVVYPSAPNPAIYPGGQPFSQTISVDLKTNPPSAINDETSASPFGWGGPSSGQVVGVHFDPDEDPGPRDWAIDYVKLARNAQGKPHFDIHFQDNAWQAGTTADLYVDSDSAGFNGTKIAASLPVANGVNTFNWNGTDANGNPLGAGTYWVYLKLTSPAAVSAQSYSTGPVDMPVQPANPPSAPGGPAAVAGLESATVSWTAPLSNGGAPITNYLVTVNPGGGTVSVPFGQTSTLVTGLTGGTGYTFTVAAQNSAGVGPASGATPMVTPTARPGTRFHAIVPYRVLDSRGAVGGWGSTGLGPHQARDLVVAGTGGAGGVPATASAVVVNVTATGGTAPSFLTVYPSGAVSPTPSNLNFGAGQTIPNLVTAKVGANGSVAIYNENGATNVVVDAVGYFDDGLSATGDLFQGITPTRVLDSRSAVGGWNGKIGAATSTTRDLVVRGPGTGVPVTATAVILNVTSTASDAGSFLTIWPAGQPRPTSSNLNFGPGQTIPNLVVAQVGDADSVSFFNAVGNTHVVADVMGYFDPTAGGSFFHAMAPVRVLDDRSNVGGYNTPWPATPPAPARAVTIAGANGIPAGATGVVVNTTVTGPSAASFVQVFPDGVAAPITSNVNFGPGQTIPNLVMVQLPGNGKIAITNLFGTVDVIGDVSGYFAPT